MNFGEIRVTKAEYRSTLAGLAMAVACLAAPASLRAQAAGAPISQSELQPSEAGSALASAMTALAQNPRDLEALLMAGEAALKLDDPRAALGFFGRADGVSPNNGRAKAGLGRAMLRLDQLGDGLRLMEQAGRLGYADEGLYVDRGLARDLVGNQAGAQQDYQAALRLAPDDALAIRRYAVSLGIGGHVDQAEKLLKPLLYKSDRGAWRDDAFILAMNGRTDDALSITSRVMPRALADAIKPYMERMAMLTPEQRAAAVHLGQFPPGLVNVRVASTALPTPAATAQAAQQSSAQTASASVAPARGRAASRRRVKEPTLAQAAVAPAVGPASSAALSTTRTPDPAERPPIMPAPAPAPAPVPARAVPNGTSVASRPAATAPASLPQAPAPQALPPQPPESPRTLADIMAEIEIPDEERKPDVTPVNLAEIAAIQDEKRKAREAAEAKAKRIAEAAKRKAEAEAKAKADAEKKRLAANPARYWVQIGAGNKSAAAFTLKRMKKQYDALGKHDGWTADWGRTNRLVVGPFSNLTKAKAVEAEMKKAGSDAFVWRSDAGEEVTPIGGK